MQDSLPAGGLRLYREGVEPSGSLRKVSGYISILLSRTSPVARVVYAKRPFGGPEAVLAYLARYTHRVAISNSRLIALDDNGVTFRWKDYRARSAATGKEWIKTMKLAPEEFLRRFLLHVLPGGFHRIRHYGFLASGRRAANIDRIRELIGEPEARAAADTPNPSFDKGATENTLSTEAPCPCCGGRMRTIETFTRGQTPRSWPTNRIWIDSS
jgi:hypothetical protein